jgi:hypothetical protein
MRIRHLRAHRNESLEISRHLQAVILCGNSELVALVDPDTRLS